MTQRWRLFLYSCSFHSTTDILCSCLLHSLFTLALYFLGALKAIRASHNIVKFTISSTESALVTMVCKYTFSMHSLRRLQTWLSYATTYCIVFCHEIQTGYSSSTEILVLQRTSEQIILHQVSSQN